jgi:hypothetical protein
VFNYDYELWSRDIDIDINGSKRCGFNYSWQLCLSFVLRGYPFILVFIIFFLSLGFFDCAFNFCDRGSGSVEYRERDQCVLEQCPKSRA